MTKYTLLIPITLCLALGACSSAKETLGLTKKSPDEFKVLKRAPLALPPDYALRPPRPGAARPQEQNTSQLAAQTIFGFTVPDAPSGSNSGETLLQKAGAGQANPNIRNELDTKVEELNETSKKKSVAERLLGIGGIGNSHPDNDASIIDPVRESERLKKNAAEGKNVNDGETPVIEQ